MDLVELAEAKINMMIDNSINNYVEKLENDNEKLQQRIDKAIEYIEHEKYKQTSVGLYTKNIHRNLLKILKGE